MTSEPEPDLLVLKPRADDYVRAHPRAEDALLLIEVADSSLAFDQGPKRDLYAKFVVVEYWVIDVNTQQIYVHSNPMQGVYQQVREYAIDDAVSPQAFPDVTIKVRELFT